MKHLIYGLVDPRTLLVHYIGLSSVGMIRPRQHRRTGTRTNERCREWLTELFNAGLERSIVVLETSTAESLKADERWWIAYGRACGWPLMNLTAGGDGCLDPHPSTRAKLRARSIEQSNRPGYRDELSARARRQMEDDGQRDLRRRITKERMADPAAREHLNAAVKAARESEPRRLKMAATAAAQPARKRRNARARRQRQQVAMAFAFALSGQSPKTRRGRQV